MNLTFQLEGIDNHRKAKKKKKKPNYRLGCISERCSLNIKTFIGKSVGKIISY